MRFHPRLERPGLPILGMVSQAGMCVLAVSNRLLAFMAQTQRAGGCARAVVNEIDLRKEEVYDELLA